MLIIDHLQLVSTGKDERNTTRNNELDEITRRLKALAREYKMVVIATSQLNRAVVSRDGKPPNLSDLRDSGTIEQNADIVILIHQPKNDTPDALIVKNQFLVAKNRSGDTGDVGVWFQKQFNRFVEA